MFNSIDIIKANGFQGFKSVKDLFLDKSSIPNIKGVYLVLYLDIEKPEFLIKGSGPSLYKKKRNPNISVEELESYWTENVNVVNIGKAGGVNQKGVESKSTLRKRINTYLSFGQGKDVTHFGGRLIWQLKNYNELVFCWITTPNSEPREIEEKLILEFKDKYGKRPFANLRD